MPYTVTVCGIFFGDEQMNPVDMIIIAVATLVVEWYLVLFVEVCLGD